MSQAVLMNLMSDMYLKIVLLKWLPYLPGANEIMHLFDGCLKMDVAVKKFYDFTGPQHDSNANFMLLYQFICCRHRPHTFVHVITSK